MKNIILTIMILLVVSSLFGQGFLSKYTGAQIETILDYSDGVTPGTAQASKALILDASGGITLIKVNLPNNTFITATKYTGGENYDLIKLNIDDNMEIGRPMEIGNLTIPLAAGVKTFLNIDADGGVAGTKHGMVIMANDTDSLFSIITEDDGASGIQNTKIISYYDFSIGNLTTLNSVSIDLTPAQINALETTPIQLVAAQGANTIIEFVSAVMIFDYTANFTVTNIDNGFVIQYDASTDVSESIDMNTFLEGSADAIRWCLPVATSDTDLLANVNKKLEIFNEGTGDVTGGTGSGFTVKITYRVHKTGL